MIVRRVTLLILYALITTVHNVGHAKSDATIIYAADLPIIGTPEHGDYAELATLVNGARKTAPETPHFFLFGGASLAPSPLASFDSGSHIVDILNLIEPDAMSVTKREFSYFEDELTLRSYEAAFPLLLSNAVDKQSGENLDGMYSDLLLSKLGFRMGIISVIHPMIGEQYLLQRLLIQNPKDKVIEIATKMRKQGADIVILLHSDYFAFINTMLDQELLDLAIQSEPHSDDKKAKSAAQHPRNILIDNVGTAAKIDVGMVSDRPEFSVQFIDLSTLKPDPLVAETVNNYKSRLASQLDRSLGIITTRFETTRQLVRTQESAFANLVTDAMISESQAEIAILNGGVIRGNRQYATEQPFMYGDLLEELPFRTRMVVIEVSGQQIQEALENGVSQLAGFKGRFPQVSGITYSVSPDNEVGMRISNVQVNNTPLGLDNIYTLATTDYLYQGGDGYSMFENVTRRFDKSPTTPLISDVLARYIRTTNTVSPYLDNRIKFVGSPPE